MYNWLVILQRIIITLVLSSIFFFLLSFPFLSFLNLLLLNYFMFKCPLPASTSWAICEQRKLICIFLLENKWMNEQINTNITRQNLHLSTLSLGVLKSSRVKLGEIKWNTCYDSLIKYLWMIFKVGLHVLKGNVFLVKRRCPWHNQLSTEFIYCCLSLWVLLSMTFPGTWSKTDRRIYRQNGNYFPKGKRSDFFSF